MHLYGCFNNFCDTIVPMAKAKKNTSTEVNSSAVSVTIAKQTDGTVEVNFVIPSSIFLEHQEHVLEHLAKEVTVAGFRPGKAPADKAKEKIKPEILIQETFSHILPEEYTQAIVREKINPAIYPKFEITKVPDNQETGNWEAKATTCELPDIDLGDYKKIAQESLNEKNESGKELTREEKENRVLKAYLSKSTFVIPKIIIDEEVSSRLSSLLHRIEKLGLTIEGYLSSIKKSVEDLKSEYEAQAVEAIRLELILTKIGDLEKIDVSENEISEAVKISSGGDANASKKLDTPDQRRIIGSVLRKRKVLDLLISLG